MDDEENILLSEEQRRKRARLLESIEASIFMPHLKHLLQSDVPGLSLNQAQSDYRRGDISVLYSAMLSRGHSLPEQVGTEAGGKRKRGGDSPSTHAQAHAIGRPWDRGELYMRLQTFKSMTWFAKPADVGAVECARRGWENTGTDELKCETCRVVLAFPKNVDLDVMPAVVSSFKKKLETSHDPMCPWRSSVCSLSLLAFPTALPDLTMIADFESRVAALKKLLCIPPVVKDAVDTVVGGERGECREAIGRLLRGNWKTNSKSESDRVISRLSSAESFDREDIIARATFLALCGWSLRVLNPGASSALASLGVPAPVKPTEAALQCTMCGTRLGLWSFFGDGRMPMVQNAAAGGVNKGPALSLSRSSIAVSNQVAMNLQKTIAGGLLHGTTFGEAITGPFGGPQAASSAFSMGCSTREERRMPITTAENTATRAPRLPDSRDSRFLASYKASCRSALDPLDAHKPFCPWANVPSVVAGTCNARPGWMVYLDCIDGRDGFKRV